MAGALIPIVGVAFTTIVIAALLLLPPLSLIDATIVCVPLVSAWVTLAPWPRLPSWLDVQSMFPEMVPSSASLADPLKVIGVAGSTVEPVAGASIVTVGVALTTTVIVA